MLPTVRQKELETCGLTSGTHQVCITSAALRKVSSSHRQVGQKPGVRSPRPAGANPTHRPGRLRAIAGLSSNRPPLCHLFSISAQTDNQRREHADGQQCPRPARQAALRRDHRHRHGRACCCLHAQRLIHLLLQRLELRPA